jgi:MoxR-like ATPase
MRFTITETVDEIAATHRPLVLITSNNEKEFPDAFLRRCIFYYIEFPDVPLMRQIIDVHQPMSSSRSSSARTRSSVRWHPRSRVREIQRNCANDTVGPAGRVNWLRWKAGRSVRTVAI